MTPQRFPSGSLHASQLAMRRGRRTLFREIGFELPAGGLLELCGPNGVGKSTLLRGLAGLSPLQQGSVGWRGEEEANWRQRLLFAGHLPAFNPAFTARENLQQLAFLDGVATNDAVLEPQLAAVGLARVQSLPVGRLSQGQLRRLVLARLALAGKAIWLLDEPLTAIDAAGVSLFAHVLAQHLQQGGVCIAATHVPIAPLLPQHHACTTLQLVTPSRAEAAA